MRGGAHWAFDAHDIALVTRYLHAIAEEHYFGGLRIGAFASRAVELANEFDEITRGVATASAALEAYDRGDVDLAVELGERAWNLALELDHPWPLAVYSMRTMPGVAVLDSMRGGVEFMRHWSQDEIDASGTTAERARIYCSFATMALQTGSAKDALEWATKSVTLARESRDPSSLAEALYEFGACIAAIDEDAAETAFAEATDLGRKGAVAIGHAAALFQWALIKARRGEHAQSAELLREAIETLRPRGRTPELDGACGYAREILPLIGQHEATATALGAVFDGSLCNLREMAVPPDRNPIDVRGLRTRIGEDRFADLIAHGGNMTYDGILDLILNALADF